MQFRVLGPVELAVEGRALTVASPRRRRLLSALVSHAGQVATPEQLIDAVWGTDPPGSARPSLQSHVSRLRMLLRDLGDDQERIVTRGRGYGLVPAETDEIDAERFDAEVEEAQALLTNDPAAALQLIHRALARWRGPPYADAQAAVDREVSRLWSVHRAAHDVRVDALLACGRAETVVGDLEARVEHDPLDERAVGQLMLARFRSGRQAEAIAGFHALRRRLGEELGVDPSPWLQDRYDALVRQDQSLVASVPERSPRDPGPGTVTSAPPMRGRATSFVGRAADVVDIAHLVASASLVTLTGPGGVGKTRLAEAVVGTVCGVFDEVIMAELAAVRERSSLAAAVAAACGIVPGDGTALGDRLVDALGGRRMLLVADNCEHLLPEVAQLIGDLLERCPRLTVLATSRERLAVPGEHRWPVTPLRLPPRSQALSAAEVGDVPAIRMFCDRAVAADPTFAPTSDDLAAVTEICRRLDGLPLALELAAARVSAFTVHDLAEHLDERFELLTTGPAGEGGRHRTLREVVAWSYRLLAPAEADLFDRLSVFAGGFTLRSAEEVTAGPDAPRGGAAAGVASLVDCSMVVRSGSRYAVPETLRLYGADRLAQRGDEEHVRRAHARHFAAFSEEAGLGIQGPHDRVWATRLEAELGNLRAAHRWAVDDADADLALRLSAPLGLYADWWLVDEIPTWAEQAAATPGAGGHPLLPVALGAAARGAGNRGQLDRSSQLARRALAAADGDDDPARILPLRALSLASFYEGSLEVSAELEAKILELAEATGDHYHVVYVWVMRTLIATYRGDTEGARAAAQHAGREADELGNAHMRALTAYCRAEALAGQEPDAALQWLDRAVTTAHEVGARLAEAVALVTRSSVRADGGDPDAALDSFREAIVRLRRGGDWTHQWTTLRNLVFLMVRLGVDEAAAELVGTIDTTSTAAPAYGADAARLRAATDRLRERLGRSRYRAAYERGRRRPDTDAVETALTVIDRLRTEAS